MREKNHKDKTSEIIGGADKATSILLKKKNSVGESMADYKSITMDEAKEIFKTSGDYIILDVRRSDEFASGHIPGAVNYANEDISNEKINLLPDYDQTIYVYCRTGRRSNQAAGKLVKIGYKDIIECGGILDWTGDIEK